jgi:surface protein
MFEGAKKFNQPIGGWNINAVTNMDNMFYRASSFKAKNNCSWDINTKTSQQKMYDQNFVRDAMCIVSG